VFTFNTVVVGLGVLFMVSSPVIAFERGLPGKDAPGFNSLFGNWFIDKDGHDQVYAEDGGKREQGTFSPVAQASAAILYGDKGADFLKNISPYKAFPLSLYRETKDFMNGSISVSFKAISGKEDQAAGIAFNVKESGEYLVVRANALENNLILFSFANGQRSHVIDVENVPTAPQQWHTLKVVIKGNNVEGYVDDKKYLDYALQENVKGRIGLWSKSDSHVLFKSFISQSK
jgi:hypothetical protein